MTNHRTLTAAAAIVTGGLVVLSACGSSSSSAASAGAPGGGVDRSSVDAVAAAFATDYASGNTPAACALTTGAATTRMTSKGLCSTQMSWNEVPRQIVNCPVVGNAKIYAYEVDHEIARFLIFAIRVESVNNVWSVAAFQMSTPGDGNYGCKPIGANNGNG